MANKFTVQPKALVTSAEQVLQLMNEFKTRLETMSTQEEELNAMWEGDSKQAFRTAFLNDKAQMENFHNIVLKYIEALEKAANDYVGADTEGASIAARR